MARDLSSRSLVDLLDEARRRGIVGAESMDRAALIESLSEARGPLSFARSLIGRVVRAMIPSGAAERAREGPARAVSRAPEGPRLPSAAVETLLDPIFTGVTIHDGDALAIVWRLPAEVLEIAAAIAPPGAGLRARVLRFSWPEGASEVRAERTEHADIGAEGALALPRRTPGETVVVGIGLGTDQGEFVAAIHARL